MYFKRLELHGFKSFADKTSIELNDGITCIVGPNGSGKSNFSDAIKWVLGEQRAGELRGKHMQDVIFNGTERRGAMSLCEVSLVFDNSDRVVFPTLLFDEVVITRKLYRQNDGGEYLLNNVNCRLKDIRDLVSDTGLGKDGFSIIGQGQVAKIINSKPEDRRVIFEEAAGISKYKKRKNEAENKLKVTREHLNRLSDIIFEIERNLAPLEKQSNDARKYNEYYNELRSLEINHYLFSFDNNKVIKSSLNQKIQGIREEIEQIERELKQLDERYFRRNSEIATCDSDLNVIRAEQTDFMVDVERRQGHNNVLAERLGAINQDIAKTNANIERMTKQLTDKQVMLTDYSNKQNELSCSFDEKQTIYSDADIQYTTILDDILKNENEMEESSRNVLDAMDKLGDVKADMSKFITEQELLKERISENKYLLQRDGELLEKEEGVRRSIEMDSEKTKVARDNAYKQRVTLRNSSNELKMEEQIISREVVDLNNSVNALTVKIDIISKVKNDYDSYNIAVKKLMEECKTDHVLRNKVIGVVAELVKVEERYETAIEIALGANLQHIATANDDDVKYIIQVLKNKRFGRLTVLPISVLRPREIESTAPVLKENGCLGVASKLITFLPQYYNLFSNLLGATLVFDNYDNALATARKYNRQYRIVTIEGELLAAGGAITGGSSRVDRSSILSQERDIERMNKLLGEARIKLSNRGKRLDFIKKDYERITDELQSVNELLQQKEIEYAKFTEREELIENVIDKLLVAIKANSDDKAKFEQRLDLISSAISNADKMADDITGQRLSVNDINSKAKQAFEERKKKREQLAEIRDNLRLEMSQLRINIDNTVVDIERIAEECNTLVDAIDRDAEAVIVLTKTAILVKESLTKAIMTDEDKSRLKIYTDKIQSKEGYKRELNADLYVINQQKDEKSRALTTASERKVKEENSLDKIDAAMFALTERLQEEYDVNHEKAQEYRIANFEDSGVQQEIINLKRKITSLGVVNVAAIEKFIEESARHTAMSDERDDLEKAEKELLGIIAELSKEMLDRFNTEFKKISTNFEQTFRDIFGGGRGQLVVDHDAEDPLSAGVEILAQPPGKNLGALSLFSGGEMALTAIAILFAILKTKPMPFCVLDEIEAALDESNARLFAKYLRRFVDETQFIVITHRKPTMEQADRLYGVTMEEKGVSKVVSVELNDAVKTAEVKENKR